MSSAFSSSPPLAFAWTDPPMLGWLAAAAAPILIYLLMRRTRRATDWAAMDVLRAAVRRRSRRIRFEHWLLLAVRTMLIALVVVAVAGPSLESSDATLPPGQYIHRVLVFDCSFSMAYKPGDLARFDRAKALARQIVEDCSAGDVFSLVLMSRRPGTVLAAALDRAAVLREIDNLRIAHERADLPAAIAEIARLTDESREKQPNIGWREVCFLTDLQRTTWAPRLSAADRAEFLRRSTELAKSAALVVIDVGQPGADNLAVVDLSPSDPPVLAGRPASLRAKLKNFGRQPRAGQNVDLLIDGRRIARRQVDVPPGGAATVEFPYEFDSPGDRSIEIVAPGDDLEIDNHRFLALPVRRELRVLCIDGRPADKRSPSTADYLALALAPGDRASGDVQPRVETAPESALLDRNLADYDCLFLCNVARFTAGEARSLGDYLRGGGGAVFFLGDRVQAENYNRLLGPAGQGRAGGANCLPARLRNVVERPHAPLDPRGFRHPIMQAFSGRGQAGLISTPVFKLFRLSPWDDATAATVLATAEGDPLVVERRAGQGRAVLVATAAEPEWSALPLWPSFVPLVREIADFCAADRLRQRNVLAGEPLAWSLPADAAGETARVVRPDGGDRTVRIRPDGDRAEFSFPDTGQSGFYIVELVPPEDKRTWAVNVDPRESDLARIEPAELQAETWPAIDFRLQADRHASGRTAGGPAQPHSGLSVVLLYCVLGLLFADTFLGWKFGHQ